MGLFGSFRMNSHYGVDSASPHHSAFRLKHPQWLIGHPAGYSKESKEYGIRMGLNYAIPEVRKHMAATIVEVFTDFRWTASNWTSCGTPPFSSCTRRWRFTTT